MKNERSKAKDYKRRINAPRILSCVFCLFVLVVSAGAQSTDQNFPTPVTTGEITGKITARDVGDARVTSYFFVFNGTQGDVFINVKTANLDGDIDVFAHENLRPLTKITIYSDAPETETGRVVYLRKPEKIILRVQGRSPNDAAATFSIKFAGSFAAASASAASEAPDLPTVKSENQSDVIVNSVGTIIGTKPKPTPVETVAENAPPKNKSNRKKKTSENIDEPGAATTEKNDDEKSAEPVKEPENSNHAAVENEKPATNAKTVKKSAAKAKTKKRTTDDSNAAATPETKKAAEPNPLDGVRLVVLFKDGTTIERAMSEVLRVGVDKGVLTLITKDGKIARYPILDVAKMTIE